MHSLEEIFRRHKKHYCETGEHTLPRPRLLKACSPSPHLHDFVDGLLRLVVEERVGFGMFCSLHGDAVTSGFGHGSFGQELVKLNSVFCLRTRLGSVLTLKLA